MKKLQKLQKILITSILSYSITLINTSHAGLLDDNEARQAILELRQKTEQKIEKTQEQLQLLFNNQKQLVSEQLLDTQNQQAINNKINNQTQLIQSLAQQQQLNQQQQQQLLLKLEQLIQQQTLQQQRIEQTEQILRQLAVILPVLPELSQINTIANNLTQTQQIQQLQQQDLNNLKVLMQKMEVILTGNSSNSNNTNPNKPSETITTLPTEVIIAPNQEKVANIQPTKSNESIDLVDLNIINAILQKMNTGLNQANDLFGKGKFKESQQLLQELKRNSKKELQQDLTPFIAKIEKEDIRQQWKNTLIEIFTLQGTNEYALNKGADSLAQLQQAQNIIENESNKEYKNHIKLPEILWLKYTVLNENNLPTSNNKDKVLKKLVELSKIDFYKNNEWVQQGINKLK